MDPTPAIVNSLILPHGAYYGEPQKSTDDDRDLIDWPESSLNPKNRVDSLDSSEFELWDVDGGEPDRGFFCTVPKFARGRPPLRVTTHLDWESVRYSHVLRQTLDLPSFFRAGKWRIGGLPLTKYLRKALTHWSNHLPDFERKYESMPFGSRILISSIHTDFSQMHIHLLPDPSIEHSWLSIDTFAKEASISVDHLSSISVSWHSLRLLSHPHENISIVALDATGNSDAPTFVFKALMQDLHYMYHELRLLLSMEAHPNIVDKPYALVLKDRPHAGPGIVGFLLKLYSGPTLQQRLQAGPIGLEMKQKLAWSCQLTSALLHVQNQATGYFPDLKPNNIVLTAADPGSPTTTLILLDFEQRGTWYTWAPPEVRYVEYIELLALTGDKASVRERYAALLAQAFPHWPRRLGCYPLNDAKAGYNLAWTCLSPQDRIKAQIHALGKVLWCIFECLPSPDGPRNVESFLEDFKQTHQFPEFSACPPDVQKLVRRCTAGAPEWGMRPPGVIRDGDKIVPWGKKDDSATACETQNAATKWWQDELVMAEEYIRHRYMRIDNGDVSTPEHVTKLERDIQNRPSLEEILETLSVIVEKYP